MAASLEIYIIDDINIFRSSKKYKFGVRNFIPVMWTLAEKADFRCDKQVCDYSKTQVVGRRLKTIRLSDWRLLDCSLLGYRD